MRRLSQERLPKMTPEEFQRESAYQLTLYHLQKLREERTLSQDEYSLAELEFKKKYVPRYPDLEQVLPMENLIIGNRA